jgi:hypothetical protein
LRQVLSVRSSRASRAAVEVEGEAPGPLAAEQAVQRSTAAGRAGAAAAARQTGGKALAMTADAGLRRAPSTLQRKPSERLSAQQAHAAQLAARGAAMPVLPDVEVDSGLAAMPQAEAAASPRNLFSRAAARSFRLSFGPQTAGVAPSGADIDDMRGVVNPMRTLQPIPESGLRLPPAAPAPRHVQAPCLAQPQRAQLLEAAPVSAPPPPPPRRAASFGQMLANTFAALLASVAPTSAAPPPPPPPPPRPPVTAQPPPPPHAREEEGGERGTEITGPRGPHYAFRRYVNVETPPDAPLPKPLPVPVPGTARAAAAALHPPAAGARRGGGGHTSPATALGTPPRAAATPPHTVVNPLRAHAAGSAKTTPGSAKGTHQKSPHRGTLDRHG